MCHGKAQARQTQKRGLPSYRPHHRLDAHFTLSVVVYVGVGWDYGGILKATPNTMSGVLRIGEVSGLHECCTIQNFDVHARRCHDRLVNWTMLRNMTQGILALLYRRVR
jgi:hypothetical protein